MTLPSASNAISMSDIRTEFGVSGELSLGTLYQASGTGATNSIVRNVDSNDAIPDSGEISFGDFHGITGNSATGYEIVDMFTDSSSRQYCFSKASFGKGMLTGSSTTSDDRTLFDGYFSQNSTSISGSNTFSSTLPNGIWGAASGSTHIAMNLNHGSTSSTVDWAAITIGGSGVTETNDSNCNLIYNYYSNNKTNSIVRWNSHKSNSDLAGLAVGVTYGKTVANLCSMQMYFAIPGKWSKVTSNSTSGNAYDIDGNTPLISSASFTAAKGDLVFTLSQQWYNNYTNHNQTVSNSTKVFQTRTFWYQNANLNVYKIDSAGSCTIAADSDATSSFRGVSYIVYRMD